MERLISRMTELGSVQPRVESLFCFALFLLQDFEKSSSMSSRMKGAGGIGGQDGDIEKPLSSRPYPPGLQPGGELCISSLSALSLPHINDAITLGSIGT